MKKFTKISMILLSMTLLVGMFFACRPNDTEEPQQKYKLTIEVQGNGTVDPPAGTYEYDAGMKVTIKAMLGEGSDEILWSGDVTAQANDTQATVKMDADKTVKVEFVAYG